MGIERTSCGPRSVYYSSGESIAGAAQVERMLEEMKKPVEPYLVHLFEIEWQFFVHLSFPFERYASGIRFSIVRRWIRIAAGIAPKSYFANLPFAFAFEEGGVLYRKHAHGVIGGFQPSWADADGCRQFERIWMVASRGGVAKVDIFDPRRNGLVYMCKQYGRSEFYRLEMSKIVKSGRLQGGDRSCGH